MSTPDIVEMDAWLAPLAEQFLRNKRKDVWSLRGASVRSDFESMRRIGGNLAGTAGAYGFPGLVEIGRLVAIAASVADVDGLRALAVDLERYLDRVQVRARPQ